MVCISKQHPKLALSNEVSKSEEKIMDTLYNWPCCGMHLLVKSTKKTFLESFQSSVCRHEFFTALLSFSLVVSWLRWLVAGMSSQKPGFAPGSIHMGFVVD
jgi:hypothetical protein